MNLQHGNAKKERTLKGDLTKRVLLHIVERTQVPNFKLLLPQSHLNLSLGQRQQREESLSVQEWAECPDQ